MVSINVKKPPRKAADRRRFMRSNLFPDIPEEELWLRKKKVGFTTIPRTMSLIGRIQDHLSEKGFPLSGTYLTLWCWVFDEGFLEIRNPKEFAFESGFTGPRAEATWKNRMLRLEGLGFIKAKEGLSGPFHNVVLLDPVRVIQKIYDGRPHDLHYGVFFSRLTQIGANDVAVEENDG
jgi:hypothetical protein